MEELTRILQRLRPERVALILDSCFSGAAEGGRTLFDPAVRTRGVVTDEFLSRLAGAGKGRVVLTASGANEIALEPRNLGHGVFTYFLLEGLRGAADDDGDGQVDVDEIYKYVSRKVSDATRGSQRPMKKASSQTGIVVLGRTSVRAHE
jgi:helicase